MKIATRKLFLVFVLVACVWGSATGTRECDREPDCDCGSEPEPEPRQDPVCLLPMDRGNGCGDQKRVYYNCKKDKCEYFHYTGCGGNGNNFDSMRECKHACQPKEKSHTCIINLLTNWIKKAKPGKRGPKCKMCAKCAKCMRCMKKCGCEVDRCSLPVDGGNGQECHQMFYYDPERNSCSRFVYTGRGGNANRFDDLRECEQACQMNENPSTYRPPE